MTLWASFRQIKQQDATQIGHGVRVRLHRMVGASYDQFKFHPVDVGALGCHITVIAGLHRAVASRSACRSVQVRTYLPPPDELLCEQ